MKIRKLVLKKIGALGTAVALVTTLCSCSMGDSNSPVLPDEDTSITDVNPTYSENVDEDEKDMVDATSKNAILSDELVLSHLTDDDKPFRLNESYLNEDGVLVYQEFGPEFYEKEINGLKYLINAETHEVCIRGYSNLGRLSCIKSLKCENGGIDSDSEYSGYVLLVIHNDNGDTLFDLYDFDDFTPVLKDCDLSGSTSFTNNIYNMYHLSSYDPKYRGNDDDNEYAGYVFRVEKDDICYFVDVNDFSKIVLSGDFTFYNENISATGNATITYYDYDSHKDVLYRSEDLVPTYSDVLQKTLVKKDDKK